MGDTSYELLQTEQISIQGMDLEVMLNFSDMLIREGSYRYFVDIQPIDGEESDRDNEKFADVTVVNQKRRILLLGGSPSFLFRFLRDFFLRDPGIQLSTWLQCADLNYPQDGNVPISRPPATDEDLRPFDAVVLIDPDPSSLRPEFIPALKRFVSDMGGGLAYVAGEHYTRTMSGSPRGRELLSLLPILLEEGHPGNDLGTAWRASLTAAGKTHAICQLRARVDENTGIAAVVQVSLPAGVGDSYSEELARLEALLSEHRDELDPNTVRILEKNLAIIDRAIEESGEALAGDPGNEYLREHLDRAVRRKVDYLRDASLISGWSG